MSDRIIVFRYQEYYPSGGFGDVWRNESGEVLVFDSVGEAKEAVIEDGDYFDNIDYVNLDTFQVL